jgi:hypothetical protein
VQLASVNRSEIALLKVVQSFDRLPFKTMRESMKSQPTVDNFFMMLTSPTVVTFTCLVKEFINSLKSNLLPLCA